MWAVARQTLAPAWRGRRLPRRWLASQALSPEARLSIEELVRLSKQVAASPLGSGSGSESGSGSGSGAPRPAAATPAGAASATAELTRRLRSEAASFQSADVLLLVGAVSRLGSCDRPLLEAVASHVMRRMASYPLFALCNIAHGFARLRCGHRDLFDAIARHYDILVIL